MSSEEIPSLLVIGRAHFSHWLHNFCVDKREEEGKPGEIFMFVLSLTFCHVSFSKKMWNEICQTSVRGPIGFGATSLTAFLIVVKCRGCREEQSGADTLRSVVGWVGIVNDWLLENEMKMLKTGIVIWNCERVLWRPACWISRQQNKCLLFMFPCLRSDWDPQGCCETNREELIMLSDAQHTKLLRAGPHWIVVLTTKLWYS